MVGAMALSSVGHSAGKNKQKHSIAPVAASSIGTRQIETDVLVVGGGLAGLFAAVKASDAGASVTMVSKGRLGSSGQTPFARGIFSFNASKEKMSLEDFVDKVSSSALGTNNPAFTRQMAKHSEARVNELKEWGFFDSPLYNTSFLKPMKERSIPVMERIMITHLTKGPERITGAAGFSFDDGTVYCFSAKSIVLCTGAGGFKPNGFPICDLTHDGSMMAYRIGAKITGKEWNDGHPANAKNPAAVFDQWGPMLQQVPGLAGVSIRHDLGVDSNYSTYMLGPRQRQEKERRPGPPGMGEKVAGGPYRPQGLEDKRHGPPPGRENHVAQSGGPGGPGGRKEGEGHGPPPGMGGTPTGGGSAGMAIHKAEGLVPVNLTGESHIPGLYAAGDALGSHMAGGIYTQIGSSMAGSAVQGAVAGQAAAEAVQSLSFPVMTREEQTRIKEDILAPLKRERGYSPRWVTQNLQSVMIPNYVLYIKKERMLEAALAYVEELRDHHQPMLAAADLHDLRLAHETTNMILNAEMKLRASLMRKESRCSHYRLDYPDMDRKNWDCWINIKSGRDGAMELEKQPFTQFPA